LQYAIASEDACPSIIQPIARKADQEDKCTGHFWESRFISQPLLTEEAVLSCMAYVDLNPVCANIAPTPEASEHTSIQERTVQRLDLAEAIKGQRQIPLICRWPSSPSLKTP